MGTKIWANRRITPLRKTNQSLNLLLVSNVLEIPVVFIKYIRGIRTAHVNDKIFIVTDLFWKLPKQKPTGRTCLLIEIYWYVGTFVKDHFYTLVKWIIDSCFISCSDLLCCCVQALLEEWIATGAFRDSCHPQVSMPLWKLWYTYNWQTVISLNFLCSLYVQKKLYLT